MLKTKVYALIDCNNFYASCERVFNPKLRDIPIVILSNNDGCIIARSNEAKRLGIKMGQPVYQCEEIIQKYGVAMYSANFTLYSDMSRRIMNILSTHTPSLEIYSVDEAFISLDHIPLSKLLDYGKRMRTQILQYTGIPVSIGIAPTKTLAKAASEIAKQTPSLEGVLSIVNNPSSDQLFETLPVEDIWGVGRQYTKFLHRHKIYTAYEFKNLSTEFVRKRMTVMGLRTLMEMREIPCYRLLERPKDNQTILCSRSFKHALKTRKDLEKAIAKYTARAAEKLRFQRLIASEIIVFVHTNIHRKDLRWYARSYTKRFSPPTSFTPTLTHYGIRALRTIFKDGFHYKKAGVVLNGLRSIKDQQIHIFSDKKIERKQKHLMHAVDGLNHKWGRDILQLAAAGIHRGWGSAQTHRSKRYTTRWDELLEVTL